MNRRAREATAVGIAGAALGSGAGAIVGLSFPAAIIAGANGAISGWRGIYNWATSKGRLAFFLDSTWALTTTLGSLISHAIAAARRSPIEADLSERQNRHVYGTGFIPRKGFAVTIGNVVSGAGDTTQESRRRLVEDHEEVHVWQARILGPLFPLAYGGWMIVATPAAVMSWLRTRGQSDRSLRAAIDHHAYWKNPFERQAYVRARRANAVARD